MAGRKKVLFGLPVGLPPISTEPNRSSKSEYFVLFLLVDVVVFGLNDIEVFALDVSVDFIHVPGPSQSTR